MTVDAAIARIREFARHQGWKKTRYAREVGVADTTLRDFHEPGWNPTAETLRRLEAAIPPDWAPEDRATAGAATEEAAA